MEKLKRVKIGFLELGTLKPGEFRHLSRAEVRAVSRKAEAAETNDVDDDTRVRLLRSRRGPSLWSVCRRSARGRAIGVSEYMQRAGYRIIPVNPRSRRRCSARSRYRGSRLCPSRSIS